MLMHNMVLGKHMILDEHYGQDPLGYILEGIKPKARVGYNAGLVSSSKEL